MVFRTWIVLGLLAASPFASSQVTQTVSVGTFYNPPLLAAPSVNDVIVFVFTAGTHGVTQSSMQNPCVQLDGGFNSGLIPGNAVNPPTWNLTVTNITTPLWFFCQATTPFSHCGNGMVGAINAPNDQYASFTSAAKTVSGTPAPSTTLVLTGQGAFATAAPIIPPTTGAPSSTTSSSTSTTSTTSSSAPATSTSSPSKKSNNGAAIGGAVAGVVAVFAIGILGYLLYRAKRKQKQQAHPFNVESSSRFDDGKGSGFLPPQRTGGSDGNAYMPAPVPVSYNSYGGQMDPRIAHYQNQNSTGNFDGPMVARNVAYQPSEPASDTNERERDMGPPVTSPPATMTSMQSGYDQRTSYSDGRTMAEYGQMSPSMVPQSPRRNEAEVKEIAKEVAQLLLPQLRASSSPPPQGANRGQPLTNPHSTYEPSEASSRAAPPSQPKSPGPPEYERYTSNQ